MSKIAIISQPDQGVLIDVSRCNTLKEAIEYLSSTLQVSSQFWKGTPIALNLGSLELSSSQIAQVLAIAKGVGASPKQVFSQSELTKLSLQEHNVVVGTGEPMGLPDIDLDNLKEHEVTIDEELPVEAPEVDASARVFIYEELAETSSVETMPHAKNAVEIEDDLESHSQVERKAVVPAVLYLRQTLRSGQTVSHKGHLVIVGDVNPGAEIMAEGDITVWGALRGIAHAGIGGNLDAEIRALKLQPIQIRIGHAIARSPDRPRVKFSQGAKFIPETARIVEGRIKISCSSAD
jgi:septum site-determining protein MinC